MHISYLGSFRVVSMELTKVVGALQSPMGNTLNTYRPSGVTNAVFSRSLGWTQICQYPERRKTVEKCDAECRKSIASSIRGTG